jgi:hypothetical protein
LEILAPDRVDIWVRSLRWKPENGVTDARSIGYRATPVSLNQQPIRLDHEKHLPRLAKRLVEIIPSESFPEAGLS